MKFLMIVPKINKADDLVGSAYIWIEKLAQKVEEIYVLCLEKGVVDLPSNVKIYSLGKEKGLNKLVLFFNFNRLILKLIKKADIVFAMFSPIFIILSAPYIKIFRKKSMLWYTHKEVNLKLKLAEKIVDKIITASKESCCLKSKKLVITGHGIDVNLFKPVLKREISKNFRILSVGRISLIKDYETLIKAVDILVNQKNIKNLEVKIIGSPILKRDYSYSERLSKRFFIRNLVAEKGLQDYIEFIKGVPYLETIRYYRKTDIFVNLCSTGGVDKAVLEAMACEIPTFVCNRTFRKELGEYKKILFFKEKDAKDLAKRILKLRNTNQGEISQFLRQQVVKYHSLDNLISKLILQFK